MPDFLAQTLAFLSKGGVLMIFIFLCSIAAVVFFVERLVVLSSTAKQLRKLKAPLLDAIGNGQFERAMTLCDGDPSPLGALAKAVIKHRTLAREAIQEAADDEAKRQFARLNRFIPSLGAIASISPLLGLLGTVTGMIQVFSHLADEYAAGAHANPGMLAGGIWEALLTTAAGLCVAIPAFLMHRFLNAKLDAIWLELEGCVTEIIDILAPHPVRHAQERISIENLKDLSPHPVHPSQETKTTPPHDDTPDAQPESGGTP